YSTLLSSLVSVLLYFPHPLLLYYFFFLILRPPPKFTLFPYTTLFRSQNTFVLQKQWHCTCKNLFYTGSEKCFMVPMALTKTSLIDRKSTRLNSSHDQISYAVFCLKKKKNTKKNK